jgi:DNA-binding SARP family transcriptional activator
LKYLLSSPGYRSSAEKLIDEIWPGALLDRGREYLRREVMHLRRSLEPGRRQYAASPYLITERQGIALRVANDADDGLWVDAVSFECLATDALEALDQGQRSTLASYEALALYRGHFLNMDLYFDWIVAARRRYQRLWTALVSALAELELEDAHFDKAILLLARLVDDSPDDEAAVRRLMVAYAASGRRAEALRTYHRLQVHLSAALDIEPCADLKALEQAIRAAQSMTDWMPRSVGHVLHVSSAEILRPRVSQ